MKVNFVQEHPTTHVLIDDNVNYLRALSTILPAHNNIYKYFTNPNTALAWITDRSSANIATDCLTSGLEEEINSVALSLNLNNLHKKIHQDDRFSAVSSLIVDYDMPGMNGIEFCQAIKDPHIQKILLTGFLGEKEARHALNKGWIDMFLPKGEESAQKIAELIADADKNYFQASNSVMSAVVAKDDAGEFLTSNEFREIFEMAYQQCQAVEFYLLNAAGDYIFLDEEGQTYGFSVQNETRRKENIELAIELEVPKSVRDMLTSNQYIFCHFGNNGLPSGENWSQFVFSIDRHERLSGLSSAFGPHIFNNTSNEIKAFRPTFRHFLDEAVAVLNGA